jgi:phospholipid transport system substrate-binding protein
MVAVARYGSFWGGRFGAAAALWLVCLAAYGQSGLDADQAGPSAHEVVSAATRDVMATVERAREYADEDPARYYQAIDEILAPVIDYRGFARSVMGAYATGDRFRSLDKEGQAQLRSQLERFTAIMRSGLVATYSKGLMAFSGSRIEVSESSKEDAAKSRVSVQQLIYSEESQPYVLIYQMALDKGKQWKLRNIIIESVNLGEIYRNQFQAAARKYNGDLDAVIDNWSSGEAEG